MTSRERSEVDAILREHFYAFVQRCLFTLNPGATFMPPRYAGASRAKSDLYPSWLWGSPGSFSLVCLLRVACHSSTNEASAGLIDGAVELSLESTACTVT